MNVAPGRPALARLPAALLIAAALLMPIAGTAATLSGAPGFDAVVLPIDETVAQREYAAALGLLDAGKLTEALAALRRVQVNHPRFSRLSAVQTRIAVLQEARDAGAALPMFLDALDARDAGELPAALATLDQLVESHASSSLVDDALYLGAYLTVMDGYDFDDARQRLARLATRFPDSAYTDSAHYLSGIVHEQLGDTAAARAVLVELRDRHTALGLPFGYRWPVGTLLSRYWFDRAERRIAIIDARLRGATRMSERQRLDDGRLRVAVNVDGEDLHLLLEPSALVSGTSWRDGFMADRLPPGIGVYEGEVEGKPGSWVRATIREGAISGMVGIDGVRSKLLPAHLRGTLDYYQPAARGPSIGAAGGLDPRDPGLAGRLQAIDLLTAPPRQETPEAQRRARESVSATRQVPVSIVVDSRYDGYHGGAGLERALDYLNVADGVYRDHGLAISLDEAIVLDDYADPLKLEPGTLESILRRFRDYRLEQASRFEDSAATYLFTGNTKTDPTLGLAWIDTLCRIDGYDVGVTTPSSFGDVLLTHELGHSFGAQHDSDTACVDDNSALMWPHISERTATRLSSCSRSSVQASRARACLSNTVDLTLAASLEPGAAVFAVSHAEAALSIDAGLLVESAAPGQVDWPGECRVLSPTSAECPVTAIAPGERRLIRLPLSSEPAGAALGARVMPIGVAELRPADNLATTDGSVPAGTLVQIDGTGEIAEVAASVAQQAPARSDLPGQPASGGSGGGSAGVAGLCLVLLAVGRRRVAGRHGGHGGPVALAQTHRQRRCSGRATQV